MDGTNGATAVASATPPDAGVTEAIRAYFREDPSRLTMMAARRFHVPERAVIEALAGQWPIVRLRVGAFRTLAEALPGLGPVRVFVRSRAVVMEVVGTFGGFSETGPFLNVQTDTLDMHILVDEVAEGFAVVKTGHDSTNTTHSLQFFDRAGDAAFKVFLWEDFPDIPGARLEAFKELSRLFQASTDDEVPSRLADVKAEPGPGALAVAESPAKGSPATTEGEEAETKPSRLPIPVPPGVTAGSFNVGEKILGEVYTGAMETPKPREPATVLRLRLVVRVAIGAAFLVIGFWAATTYVAPFFWWHYEHHPKLADAPKYVLTSREVEDLPLNIGLFGSEGDLIRAMLDAGWTPADPASFQAGQKVAGDVLRKRQYPRATFGDAYVFDKAQDLIFEKPGNKTERQVARFWKSDDLGQIGRPIWIGAVYVARPGKSEKFPWHVAPNLDAAREGLVDALNRALRLTEVFRVTGSGPTFRGRTADNEPYFTDGEVTLATLSIGVEKFPAELLPSPALVRFKDRVWEEIRPLLQDTSE